MCGRFTLSASATTLVQQFELANLPAWTPRYNIALTQNLVVVDQSIQVISEFMRRYLMVPSTRPFSPVRCTTITR